MLVRVESRNPGPRRARRVSGRGLAIALFALLIAGSATPVAVGAAGAGSADGARAAGSASRVGPSLSAMTTQQALQAVLSSGAAPPSAGAAPARGQRVLAVGPVASGQDDARLIVVAVRPGS